MTDDKPRKTVADYAEALYQGNVEDLPNDQRIISELLVALVKCRHEGKVELSIGEMKEFLGPDMALGISFDIETGTYTIEVMDGPEVEQVRQRKRKFPPVADRSTKVM